MYGAWAADTGHVLAAFIERTLKNRNVTTRQATTSTDSNMARPATKLGTLMHTLSADSPDRLDTTTVSAPLPLFPVPEPVPLPDGTFNAKLTSPGATTCMTRLVFTSSSGSTPVDLRCRRCLPLPSGDMSTDRGRPPNDIRFMCCSSSSPLTVPCRLTVAYDDPCPGNGGGGRFRWSSFCCAFWGWLFAPEADDADDNGDEDEADDWAEGKTTSGFSSEYAPAGPDGFLGSGYAG